MPQVTQNLELSCSTKIYRDFLLIPTALDVIRYSIISKKKHIIFPGVIELTC
jgi:hypothetical protein